MATIKPSFLYGVRSGVRGGIHFSGEQSILYPAGSGVARCTKIKKYNLCFLCKISFGTGVKCIAILYVCVYADLAHV